MTFPNGQKARLESWKAVSVYFGRDERTVRRWEVERGLPIHRLPGGKRSQIYAEIAELDFWLRGSARGADAAGPGGTADLSGVRPSAIARPVRSPRKRAPVPSWRATPAAQEQYVEGVRAWTLRTAVSLNRALEAFNAAVRFDPEFAEAYVGLAKTYNLLREYTLMPDAQAYPMARAAARRAVELGPGLPEAHAALAFVDFWGFWDVAAADAGFRRAIALDPSSATARHWRATFLDARGDYGQALDEIDRAIALEPSSLAIHADRGELLFHAGRVDDAIAALRQVAMADPGFRSPHQYLMGLYLVVGEDRDYLREAEGVAAMSHDRAELTAQSAARAGFAIAGRRGMLAALLADRVERAEVGAASAYSVARLCALSGDTGAALAWLQKSLDKREAGFIYLICDAAFGGMGAEPRFLALAAQVKPS